MLNKPTYVANFSNANSPRKELTSRRRRLNEFVSDGSQVLPNTYIKYDSPNKPRKIINHVSKRTFQRLSNFVGAQMRARDSIFIHRCVRKATWSNVNSYFYASLTLHRSRGMIVENGFVSDNVVYGHHVNRFLVGEDLCAVPSTFVLDQYENVVFRRHGRKLLRAIDSFLVNDKFCYEGKTVRFVEEAIADKEAVAILERARRMGMCSPEGLTDEGCEAWIRAFPPEWRIKVRAFLRKQHWLKYLVRHYFPDYVEVTRESFHEYLRLEGLPLPTHVPESVWSSYVERIPLKFQRFLDMEYFVAEGGGLSTTLCVGVVSLLSGYAISRLGKAIVNGVPLITEVGNAVDNTNRLLRSSTSLVDNVNDIVLSFKNAPHDVLHNVTGLLAQLFLCVRLYVNSMYGDLVLALTSLSTHDYVKSLFNYDYLLLCFEKVATGFDAGVASTIGKIKDTFHYEEMENMPVVFRLLMDVCTSFFANLCFVLPSMRESCMTKFCQLGYSLLSNGTDFTVAVKKVVVFMQRKVAEYTKTGDLSVFLSYDSAEEEICVLEAMLNVITKQDLETLQGDGPMSAVNIYKHVTSCVHTMSTASKGVQSTAMYKKALEALRNAIHGFYGGSSKRQQPVAYFVYGEPGTGKTCFVDRVASMARAELGFNEDVDVVYWSQNVKHQNKPNITCIAVLNDFLQNKDVPGKDTLATLQMMADTAPVALEMASIEDKKLSNINPAYVFVTTNTESYQFTQSVEGAYRKLHRRYGVIKMMWSEKAKAEAKAEGYLVDLTFEKKAYDVSYLVLSVGTFKDSIESKHFSLQSEFVDYKIVPDIESILEILYKQRQAIKEKGKVVPVKYCDRGIYRIDGRGKSRTLVGPFVEEGKASLWGAYNMLNTVYAGMAYLCWQLSIPPVKGGLWGKIELASTAVGTSLFPSCSDYKMTDIPGLPRVQFYNRLNAVGAGFTERQVMVMISFDEGFPTYEIVYIKSVNEELTVMHAVVCGKTLGSIVGFAQSCSTEQVEGTISIPQTPFFGYLTPGYLNKFMLQGVFHFDISYPSEEFSRAENVVRMKFVGSILAAVLVMGFVNTVRYGHPLAHKAEEVEKVSSNSELAVEGALHGRSKDVLEEYSDPQDHSTKLPGYLGNSYLVKVKEYRIKLPIYGSEMHCCYYDLNKILVPRHFFYPGFLGCNKLIDDGTTFVIVDEFNGQENRFSFNKEFLVLHPDGSDLAMYCVGNVNGVTFTICDYVDDLPVNGKIVLKGESVAVESSNDNLVRYFNTPTILGDCGLVAMQKGRVISMHHGKFEIQKIGEGIRLKKSTLLAMCSELQEKGLYAGGFTEQCKLWNSYLPGSKDKFERSDIGYIFKTNISSPISSGFVPLGVVAPFLPSKPFVTETSLFPLFNKFLPERAGAVNGGHAKKLIIDGIEQWPCPSLSMMIDSTRNELPESTILSVVSDYADMFGVGKLGLREPMRRLTRHEAFVGCRSTKGIGAKEVDKSIGAMLKSKGLTNKSAFEQISDSEYRVHPAVLLELDRIEAALSNDECVDLVSMATVKNEVMFQSKLNVGKARHFYVPDVCINILAKMIFGPLVDYMYSPAARASSGMWCTINAMSKDWDVLGRFMNDFGPMFDTDQKGYDMHHFALVNHIKMLLNKLMSNCGYNESDRKLGMKLVNEFFKGFIVIQGVLFFRWCKMISGNWLTLFLNNLFNIVSAHVVCREITKVNNSFDYLRVVANGDDAMNAITKEMAAKLDLSKLTFQYKLLGYEVTPASKDGVIRYVDISEISFCKRSFTYDSNYGCFLGRLAMASITKSLCYSIEKVDRSRDVAALLSNFCELFLHGFDVFEKFRVIAVDGGYQPPDYTELEVKYLKGTLASWEREKVSVSIFRDRGVSLDKETFVLEGGHLLSIRNTSLEEGVWVQTSTDLNSTNDFVSSHYKQETLTTTGLENDVVVGASPKLEMPHVDEDVSLKGYFARPRRIAVYDWGATSVYTTYNLWNLYSTAVASKINDYRYYRGTMNVRFQVSGNPHYYGLLRGIFRLSLIGDHYNPEYVTTQCSTHLESSYAYLHLDCDISKGGVCEMKLPFPFGSSFGRIAEDYGWLLDMIPYKVMSSDISGATVRDQVVEIYAWFDDMELDVLELQGGYYEEGGKLTRFMKHASSIASIAGGTFGTLASKLLKLGAVASEYMGMSLVDNSVESQMISRKNGNTATGVGCTNAYSLDSNPLTQTNVAYKQFPLGVPEDMDLFFNLRRWGAYNSGSLESTVDIKISPLGGATDAWTPLKYFSAPFRHYRGKIEFKITFYCSAFMRARVGILIVPPLTVSPVAFPVNGSGITHIVEVVGTTSYEFELPFMFEDVFYDLRLDRENNFTFSPNIKMYTLMNAVDSVGDDLSLPYELLVRAGEDYEVAYPDVSYISKFVYEGKMEAVIFGTQHSIKEMCNTQTYAGIVDVPGTDTHHVSADDHYTTTLGNPGKISYARYFSLPFIGKNGGSTHRFFARNTETGGVTEYARQFRGFVSTSYAPPGSDSVADRNADARIVAITDTSCLEITAASKNVNFFKQNSLTPFEPDLLYECVNVTLHSTESFMRFDHYIGAADDFVFGGFLRIPRVRSVF